MLLSHTNRGFQLIEFVDQYGSECSLQQSSAWLEESNNPGESAVWLGKGKHRMHLDRELAKYLSEKLFMFAKTGNLFDNPPRADGEKNE